MGFLDKLLGRRPTEQQQHATGWDRRQDVPSAPVSDRPQPSEEERAVARYRYLLRTAPPEQLEAMHAEAFARLTPEQRQELLRELATASPGEAGGSSEPADLARAATRAEMRQPGTLQNTFSRGSFGGGGMGMGGMFAGSMMGTIAGVVIGSAVANMLLGGYDSSPEAQDAGDTSGDAGDGGTDAGDSGSGDSGSGDTGSGDAGGDAGYAADTSGTDSGGDWGGGGGDFGGGDFGGGDFGGF
jgi:hypothetical protein